ncbi:MAG TPA: type III pantothenate kinase [Rhodanobacter sp.]|nr:type III pantothenate kinase [Rhodanobacter sp.]
MNLLLDLGNTRLKWALADGRHWHAHGAIGWQEDVAAGLAHEWSSLPAPSAAFGASVVDAPREALVAASVKVSPAAHSRAAMWPSSQA